MLEAVLIDSSFSPQDRRAASEVLNTPEGL
jgi:hypothetical protein